MPYLAVGRVHRSRDNWISIVRHVNTVAFLLFRGGTTGGGRTDRTSPSSLLLPPPPPCPIKKSRKSSFTSNPFPSLSPVAVCYIGYKVPALVQSDSLRTSRPSWQGQRGSLPAKPPRPAAAHHSTSQTESGRVCASLATQNQVPTTRTKDTHRQNRAGKAATCET